MCHSLSCFWLSHAAVGVEVTTNVCFQVNLRINYCHGNTDKLQITRCIQVVGIQMYIPRIHEVQIGNETETLLLFAVTLRLDRVIFIFCFGVTSRTASIKHIPEIYTKHQATLSNIHTIPSYLTYKLDSDAELEKGCSGWLVWMMKLYHIKQLVML